MDGNTQKDDPKMWGIHQPEGCGLDAVSQRCVRIGWLEMGDLSKLPNDREAIKKELAKIYPDAKPGTIAVEAGMLLRFIHEVKADDYVVYPSKHDRMVNIGQFTGTYTFDPESDKDTLFPNYRSVEWLGHFPRNEFCQSALNEIGAYLSFFRIQNHRSEFLIKIKQTGSPNLEPDPDTEPDDDDSLSSKIAQQTEQTTEDFIIKRIHDRLSGHDFEHFIGHLLECMGYTVRVTRKSSDGGVDVIAHNDVLGFEPPIIKVQCKRTTRQIHETDVRELLGTLVEGEYGLFVTLGAFAPKVRQSERNLSKLRLIDGQHLVDLITKHYDDLSPRYRTLIPLQQIYVPDISA